PGRAQRRPGFTDQRPFPCSARLASNYPVRRTCRAAPAASSPAGALSLDSARRGSIYPPCLSNITGLSDLLTELCAKQLEAPAIRDTARRPLLRPQGRAPLFVRR